MRYLIGFMFILALGVMGCGETGPGMSCESVADCADDNECTEDFCDRGTGECRFVDRPDGTQCDFGELPGVCKSGRCVDADLCGYVDCSDGNDCTDDVCDPADASCANPNKDDGTECEIAGTVGECRQGACGGIFACTEEGIRAAIGVGGGSHTFDCNGPTVVTTQAEIVIDNDVILDGEGELTVKAALCGRFIGDPPVVLTCHRVISVASGTTADLIGMTVAEGCADPRDGSGILNLGTLRLRETHVVDNGWMHDWDQYEYTPCGGKGGGIYNGGTLTLTDSSVSRNVGIDEGGGIYNAGTVTLIRSIVSHNSSIPVAAIWNGGSLTMLDSTVSNNAATRLGSRYRCDGGDILRSSGSLLMINSAVSNNWVDCVSGGAIIVGSGTLINCTISGNHGARDQEASSFFHLGWNGDVISSTIAGDYSAEYYRTYLTGGGVRLANSVIVNTAFDPGTACSSPVDSGGGNIESPGDSCGLSEPTDLASVSLEELNLGPLQDNGGPTMTHALLTEPTVSVAIDQIPAEDCVDPDGAPLTTDQRGEPRPGGTMCDVGAFEVQP